MISKDQFTARIAYTIAFDNVSSQTLTLPTAVGIPGRVYVIKSLDGGGVIVATNGSETIDGLGSDSLAGTGVMTVQSDGSNWIIIAEY